MFSQKNIYQLAVTGALLLAGCTSDDVAFEAAPAGSVPLSFTCTSDDGFSEDGQEGTRAVIGYQGPMDSEDLRYTGFGVFASQSDGLPDMMYNQEVKFTYSGDKTDPLKGYWSYQPTKYWPSDLAHFRIGAYAPYHEPPVAPSDDDTDTGIVGISGKGELPYIKFRRCLKPENCVDLLWYYEQPGAVPEAGTLAMNMGHALARLEINVKLKDAPPEGKGIKVLIDSIEILGSMVKEGNLLLYKQVSETKEGVTKFYPDWSLYDHADEPRTIVIDNDDNNADSYGIIDAKVRYVKGLPCKWQPDGLSSTIAQNVLSYEDRKAYIYLIPKSTIQSLTVNVRYHKMTATKDKMEIVGTETAGIEVGNPLRGNTTYSLNLIIDVKYDDLWD